MQSYYNSSRENSHPPTATNSIDILAQRGHYPAREQPHRPKDAYLFLCPFHADENPSFSVHQDGNRWKCWAGCGSGGPRELLRLFGDNYVAPPRPAPKKAKSKGKSLQGCTLAQLAEAKGLPVNHLRSLGWRDTTYAGKPAVAIPWPGGTHYRVSLDGGQKYRWKSGNSVSLYGLDKLEEYRGGGWVLFVEGETDVAAGRLMGLPVIGVPGATTFKKEWVLQFQGTKIAVWKEPDQGGETLAAKLAEIFWDVQILEPPEGIKDLCDLHDQAREGALDLFNEILKEAQSTRKKAIPRVVPSTDITHKIDIRRCDTAQIRWDRANDLWPPDYRVPHAGKYTVRMSRVTFAQVYVKGYANTWHHPENEKHKKRLIYSNVTPRISIEDEIFCHEYHHEDFDDLKYKSLKKQVERADGNMLVVDNVQGRGSYICFSSAQIEGWERCSEVEAEFIKAISHIRVPDDTSRFQPVKGTRGWIKGMTAPRIKDADQWEDIGYSDGKDFDLVYVEAEARAERIPYDEIPVYKEWRKTGIGRMIIIYHSCFEEGLRFAASCGIKLKPKYRAMLEVQLVAIT